MEIRAYLGIIARYWWVVVLAVVAAAAAAAVFDYVRTPQYSARARVVVRPQPGITDDRTVTDLLGQMASRTVSGTFAQAITSAQVRSAALKTSRLSDAEAERYPLQANLLPDSLVIEVSGTGPDPAVLTDYINATVTAAITETRSLFRVIELAPLEPAHMPVTPSTLQPTRDIPTGAILGLAAGLLLALALDYLRGPAGRTPPTPVSVQKPYVSPFLERE